MDDFSWGREQRADSQPLQPRPDPAAPRRSAVIEPAGSAPRAAEQPPEYQIHSLPRYAPLETSTLYKQFHVLVICRCPPSRRPLELATRRRDNPRRRLNLFNIVSTSTASTLNSLATPCAVAAVITPYKDDSLLFLSQFSQRQPKLGSPVSLPTTRTKSLTHTIRAPSRTFDSDVAQGGGRGFTLGLLTSNETQHLPSRLHEEKDVVHIRRGAARCRSRGRR